MVLFWGKCVNLTKQFRWWETQLDQLWLLKLRSTQESFHVAYGKKPTGMAVVDQYLPLIRTHPTILSHEETQQYNAE